MIKIPFLNKFTTDDQEFYDTQINEELKYCSCSNYVMKFTDEFLLPPFTFKITNIEQVDDFDVFDIEETGKINPRQLLAKRVDELEEYLKANNRLDDYEKLKQIRNRILQKSKKILNLKIQKFL